MVVHASLLYPVMSVAPDFSPSRSKRKDDAERKSVFIGEFTSQKTELQSGLLVSETPRSFLQFGKTTVFLLSLHNSANPFAGSWARPEGTFPAFSSPFIDHTHARGDESEEVRH